MMSTQGVIWTEGMFLAPQHFQHMDVSIRNYSNELVSLDLIGDDYGLSRIEINEDLLRIGKLSVKSASGILPDRNFFDLTSEIALEIPNGTVDCVVCLAVPLALSGVAQVGVASSINRIIKRELKLYDLTDSDSEPLEAELAELNLSLKFDTEDLSSFAYIPICKILEKTSEGRLILDRNFMPTAISLQANALLIEKLGEILSLSKARAENASVRLKSVQNSRTQLSLISEKFELQILNKWILRLQNLLNEPFSSPRLAYYNFATMAVEMLALSHDTTPENFVFNNQKPTESFNTVLSMLRALLTLEKSEAVIELTWNKELFEKRRLLRLSIPRNLISSKRRIFLGIQSTNNNEPLAELVPKACKIAALSEMPALIQRGLPGILFKAIPSPPKELRQLTNGAFFSIDTNNADWKRLINNREILGFHVDDRIKDLDAILYFID